MHERVKSMITNTEYDQRLHETIKKLLDCKYGRKKQFSLFPNKKYSLGGMINEEQYNNEQEKILVILKEANDSNANSIKNYVNEIIIGNEKIIRTWRNIARWVIAIKTYGTYEFKEIDDSKIIESLKEIAVTNINKSGASSRTNMSLLRSKSLIQSEVILNEIDVLKPTKILCGNTYQIICEIIGKKEEKERDCCIYNDIIFINMCHPQAMIKDIEMYSKICSIVKNNKCLSTYK